MATVFFFFTVQIGRQGSRPTCNIVQGSYFCRVSIVLEVFLIGLRTLVTMETSNRPIFFFVQVFSLSDFEIFPLGQRLHITAAYDV